MYGPGAEPYLRNRLVWKTKSLLARGSRAFFLRRNHNQRERGLTQAAMEEIFKIASHFCDTAALVGPGDAQTWGLTSRWETAALAMLKRLSECPVTQYPGDQLWPSLDRFDAWHAYDTPDNR